MNFSLRYEYSNGAQFNMFSPVSYKQIWDLYKIKFTGNETIINNKEVLKGQLPFKFSFIFNIMIFANNLIIGVLQWA